MGGSLKVTILLHSAWSLLSFNLKEAGHGYKKGEKEKENVWWKYSNGLNQDNDFLFPNKKSNQQNTHGIG